MKYICQYTTQDTSFNGWRLTLQRKGAQFVRYFSALEYGGMEAALSAAVEMRQALLAALETSPEGEAERVFEHFRKERPGLPAGFGPMKPASSAAGKPIPGKMETFTVKFSPAAQAVLEELGRRWGVDRSTILRAALYLFAAWCRKPQQEGINARELAAKMEEMAGGRLPPFSQFAQPRP